MSEADTKVVGIIMGILGFILGVLLSNALMMGKWNIIKGGEFRVENAFYKCTKTYGLKEKK